MILMAQSSYEIYQVFRLDLEQQFRDMVINKKTFGKFALQDKMGAPNAQVVIKIEPEVTYDGHRDFSQVTVYMDAILGGAMRISPRDLQIKMPVAAGLALAHKAAGFDAAASLSLLCELVEMPQDMAKVFKPRIGEWRYSDQTGNLRAGYFDSYCTPKVMSHDRLFSV